MSVREYVGARYVPLFADPLTWDATRTYEPLTVVLYQGNSYTSRQAVPANIEITNTTYWAQTGNYNAQIEQYRAEVQTFDGRIEANADAISDEEAARQNADTALQTAIDDEAAARQNAIANAVDGLASETYVNNAINTSVGVVVNDINTLAFKGHLFSGEKSIGFGDSNMRGTQAGAESIIYKKLCTALGCTYDNRGVSGACFDPSVQDGNSIIAQVNSATYDADVRLVCLIGGINDWHYQTSETNALFKANVDATIAAIKTKFPNAVIATMFDHGQQYPSSTMLTFPHAMKQVTEDNYDDTVFVATTDFVFNTGAMFFNQNHYSNAGTTLLAKRFAKALMGKKYPLFSCYENGTILEGLENCNAMHSAFFSPDSHSITNNYYIDMLHPTYTSATVPHLTTVFEMRGGMDFRSSNISVEIPLVFHDAGSSSTQGNVAAHVFRHFPWNSTSSDRGSDDATIRFRNRGALVMANLANLYGGGEYTYVQTPRWV